MCYQSMIDLCFDLRILAMYISVARYLLYSCYYTGREALT